MGSLYWSVDLEKKKIKRLEEFGEIVSRCVRPQTVPEGHSMGTDRRSVRHAAVLPRCVMESSIHEVHVSPPSVTVLFCRAAGVSSVWCLCVGPRTFTHWEQPSVSEVEKREPEMMATPGRYTPIRQQNDLNLNKIHGPVSLLICKFLKKLPPFCCTWRFIKSVL